MQNSEQKLVQVIYEGQSIEVTPEVAAVLDESDKEISAQQRRDRRHNLNTQTIAEDVENLTVIVTGEFEADAVERADTDMLRDGLSKIKLSEKQRRRFEMRLFSSLTYREIAEKEGITVKSAYESIQYAMSKAKKYFQKHPTK